MCCRVQSARTHLKLRLKRAACQEALDDIGSVQAIHAVTSEDSSLLGQWLPLWVHHEVATEERAQGQARSGRAPQQNFETSVTRIHLVSQPQNPPKSVDAPTSCGCTLCGSQRLRS